ncbi:MAG: hypothetical protein JWO09_3396 [Bacteroidetes bacterium]|nr:hypothetical protein [Bacteroidota bacterium]
MRSIFHKTIFAAAVLFSTFNHSFAGNGSKADTSQAKPCLEVLGIAMDANNKPIDGVEVRLYRENDEQEWTEITNVMHHEHSFIFKLEANEYYTIEVSKPGFVTRSVGISTAIPKDVSLDQIFRYEFEVELFKEKKNMNDYYLDFPVALISYDAERDVFDNNYAYTRHIKTMIVQPVDEASTKAMKTAR